MTVPRHHLRALLVVLLVTLGVVHAQHAVHAQQVDTSALTREALAEFEAGHWEEARVLLQRLYNARPSGESLRLLGAASYELRDYAIAVRYFRRSLAEQQRPLSAARRADAQRALEAALRFVGSVRVVVPGVQDVQLRVDELDVQPDPDGSLTLSLGRHDLEVSAPGYVAQSSELRVQAGATQEVTVALRPEVPAPDPLQAQAPTATQDPVSPVIRSPEPQVEPEPEPEPQPEPEPEPHETQSALVDDVPSPPDVSPERAAVPDEPDDLDERRSTMRSHLVMGAALIALGGAALPWWLSRLDVLNNTCPCLDQERISRRRWAAMGTSLGGFVLGGVFLYSGIQLALRLRRDRSVALNVRMTGDALYLQGTF
ncbi:MAG: hypothetical protein H6726_19815 [Sandaracinaceae bacterium]|nr:hypothetical protein [Sandaracinaceae bacterium]